MLQSCVYVDGMNIKARTWRQTPFVTLLMHNAGEGVVAGVRPVANPSLAFSISWSLVTSVSWIRERSAFWLIWRAPRTHTEGWCVAMLVLICPSTSTATLHLSSSSSPLKTAGGKERTPSLFPWKPSLFVCGMRDVLCVDEKKNRHRPCLALLRSLMFLYQQLAAIDPDSVRRRRATEKGPGIRHSVFSWGQPCLMTQR